LGPHRGLPFTGATPSLNPLTSASRLEDTCLGGVASLATVIHRGNKGTDTEMRLLSVHTFLSSETIARYVPLMGATPSENPLTTGVMLPYSGGGALGSLATVVAKKNTAKCE